MDKHNPKRPPTPGRPGTEPSRTPSPAKQRRAQNLSVISMLLGIASILGVMVHFFVSPLNIKLQMSGGYNGTLFALVPMALAIIGILLAISCRKALPREHEGAAIVGVITSVIGLAFGVIQLFTCTICVQFNLFGLTL